MSDSLLTRLRVSADRIADLRKALRAEMDLRDSLICEALDTQHRYKHVAHHARRSIGTVASIYGKGDPTKQGER